ncbi:TPA: hypothetical protein I8621_004633 [Citrobacter freundii]|nr:hypothetical protein [Citrobacter freundii]
MKTRNAQIIVVKKRKQDVYIEYYGQEISANNRIPLFVGQVVISQNEYLENNAMYRYGKQFSLNHFYGLFKS